MSHRNASERWTRTGTSTSCPTDDRRLGVLVFEGLCAARTPGNISAAETETPPERLGVVQLGFRFGPGQHLEAVSDRELFILQAHDDTAIATPQKLQFVKGSGVRSEAEPVKLNQRNGSLEATVAIRDRGLMGTTELLETQQALGLRTSRFEANPCGIEDLGPDALFFSNEAEQEVLGPNVAVVQLARFAHGQLEHLLGARRIGQVGGVPGSRASLLDRSLDVLEYALRVDAKVDQDGDRDAASLADEA